MPHPEYEQSVFINCPFDPEYAPLFEAIVFAVHDAGFRPFDSERYRFQKFVSDLSGQDTHQHDNDAAA